MREASVAFCDDCWRKRYEGRPLVRLSEAGKKLAGFPACHGCGGPWSGLVSRRDLDLDPPHPASVPQNVTVDLPEDWN